MILLFLTLSQVYCPLHSALACDGSENKLRETPRGEERGGGQAGHAGHPGQGRDGAQAEGGPQVGQGAASWSPASTQHSSVTIASSNLMASSLHVAACDAVTWPMLMQHFA